MSPKQTLALPIDPLLADIVQAVQENSTVILTATPGAGKTTRLPPEFLAAFQGRILVLEPRRMAAVAAAQRASEEHGTRLGDDIGYQVRFEAKMTRATRLIYMTDALLLRRMVEDPELNGVDLVVLDEFHERNLNQDVILGCLKELQQLGSPIKILVMSATLDTSKLLRFFSGSVHIEVPGKVFPLDLRHQNRGLQLRTDFEFYNRTADAVLEFLRAPGGDILVFLPGVGEIAKLHDKLLTLGVREEILPLHGSLSLSEQQKVLTPSQARRVILSTNVAEASLTVPGVDRVIDTGLAKVMEVDRLSGFSRLELTRIARFNADQRAGRAARQRPGICLRLWSVHEEVTQPQELLPEAQRTDLAQVLLFLSHLGVSDFSGFAWLDHPPGALLSLAIRSLRQVGAIDAQNRLTDFGRELLRFPLPPRWGALLLKAEESGQGPMGARAAALLQDRDIVRDRREVHANTECDISYRLQLLDDFEHRRNSPELSTRQAQVVLESAAQLQGLLKPAKNPSTQSEPLRRLFLATQGDRLCRRRKGSERAVMIGGRGVRIDAESQVRKSEFFIALNGVDLPGQADTVVSLACGVSKELVLEFFKERITVTEDVHFDEAKGQLYARKRRMLDDLALDEPTLSPLDPSQMGDHLSEILKAKWSWLMTQNQNLQHWLERHRFLSLHQPAKFPQMTNAQIDDFLAMAAFGKTKLSEVIASDLVGLLESTLDKEVVRYMNQEAPPRFTAPSGESHTIHYEGEQGVFVDIRLQEIFGLLQTPRLAGGAVPLTFRLLGPNYRPVQVTGDLSGFWRGAYNDVRKELRSRYPKHSWPEDPVTAKPEAKGRRRS